MANGRPGDHPFTDIVVHNREVYGAEVTTLIKRIVALDDERLGRLASDLVWHMRPDLAHESNKSGMIEDMERALKMLLSVGEELRTGKAQ